MTYCRLFSCNVLWVGHLVLLDTELKIKSRDITGSSPLDHGNR
jgi:hypothetical protein